MYERKDAVSMDQEQDAAWVDKVKIKRGRLRAVTKEKKKIGS